MEFSLTINQLNMLIVALGHYAELYETNSEFDVLVADLIRLRTSLTREEMN